MNQACEGLPKRELCHWSAKYVGLGTGCNCTIERKIPLFILIRKNTYYKDVFRVLSEEKSWV